MHPMSFPAGGAPSERSVFNALSRLPDPWHVIHSVAWQSLRNGRQGDGEADFVLIHERHGLIVIEAKGGSIQIVDGDWVTSNTIGQHRINPIEQAVSSKHALMSYLRDSIEDLPWIEHGHAVWFPEIRVSGDLSAAAPDELVLDKADLERPEAAVNDIVNRWGLHKAIPTETVAAIVNRLAPTVTIRHTLADEIESIHARQLSLTDAQRQALDGLKRSRRVIVYGGAGTGKTVLAAERARRLAADGFDVVLTCFNRPLGDALRNDFEDVPTATVRSFHRLAHEWITGAGMDFPEDPGPSWWDDPAGEAVLEAFDRSGFSADAVIIDEAQGFDDSWLLALESCLGDRDEGVLLLFADRHQAIYREDWEAPPNMVPYDLDLNCRNTNQIAAVVARVYGDETATTGVDGPDVEFVAIETPEGVEKALRGALHRLVNEGQIDPADVVVLTQARAVKDRLVGQQLAGLVLESTDDRDEGVLVETIHRFKGLEAAAAIVVLNRLETDRDRALAYIGLSRPRVHLSVVGPADLVSALG